ncbi:MAG TPA: hypothetical protein VGB61_03150, partial [Pyrinomonadaceae bacterium]
MKFPLSMRNGGAALVLTVALLVGPVRAQQRAASPKPAPVAAAPTAKQQAQAAERGAPVATFDTLLSADAYGIYAEMRMVGRQAGSPEMLQLLAPFGLEGSGAPAELPALHEFLKSHAEKLMTSRLMFAMMPARSGLPEMLLAVEMSSAEEARKFVPELKEFVAAQLAPAPRDRAKLNSTTPVAAPAEGSPAKPVVARRRAARRTRARAAGDRAGGGADAKWPALPPVHIKRSGQIIAISGATFTFKNLRGADQALLADEPGFQAARTRFSTDTAFAYFNIPRMSNSARQRSEALEKEYRRQEELALAEAEKQGAASNSNRSIADETTDLSGDNMNVRADAQGNTSVTTSGNTNTSDTNVVRPPEDVPPPTPEATPPPKSEKELEEERRKEQSERFVETLASVVFGGQGMAAESWPESIGVGASLDADALVVRGLFVDLSGDQPARPVPFLPVLLSGPSIAAQAPAVLPADTDIFLSVSLDLPQMYDYIASLMKVADLGILRDGGQGGQGRQGGQGGQGGQGNQADFGEQVTAFEKTNNFRIREELLAALGNEIAVGMPGNQFLGGRAPRGAAAGDAATPPPPSGPVVVLALNDRESLQKLLPRVLGAFGFAGATEQSIVEKHGQVEVLAFSNGTLAFIDNFLVGTPDAATMRRVTDAYNGGATLANSERYRDSTSWQSKQAIAQLYLANTMLKGMFEDVTKSADDIDDPAVRAYLLRLNPDPGTVTHLATREPNGILHELRLPKNLLSLFTASTLVGQKLATMRGNESIATAQLRIIHSAQTAYKTNSGRYATLEELKAAAQFPLEFGSMEVSGYEIEVFAAGDTFEATATPTGYPKLGRRSFYIDHTGTLR